MYIGLSLSSLQKEGIQQKRKSNLLFAIINDPFPQIHTKGITGGNFPLKYAVSTLYFTDCHAITTL